MIKRLLKNWPIHILLLPTFFIWHVCNSYAGLIPYSYSMRFLGYYLVLAVVTFTVARLVLKNNIKAGCLAGLILLVFFFWGSAHDFLRALPLPPFFSSYKFLLSLVALLLIIATIRLKKNMRIPYRFNFLLNLVYTVFLLIEAGSWMVNLGRAKQNNLAWEQQPAIRMDTTTQAPDIFYFVFDEYMSSEGLKKYLQFDNSHLDSQLASHQFYTSRNSMSNYNSTVHCLASTLNFSFLKGLEERMQPSVLNVLQAQYTINHSTVPRLLKNHGYDIINYGLFDLEDKPSPYESLFNINITAALSLETLWGRLEMEMGWRLRKVTKKNFLWTVASSYYKPENTVARLNTALAEVGKTSARPRFVYIHLLMPHEPFLFLQDGSVRLETLADHSAPVADSLYLQQLRFANTWIARFAEAIDRPSSRPRVAIIMGDHGFRDRTWTDSSRSKQLMNLCSIYYSDSDFQQLYDNISPVNLFPLVLNKYFNSRLPLQKDSSIALQP